MYVFFCDFAKIAPLFPPKPAHPGSRHSTHSTLHASCSTVRPTHVPYPLTACNHDSHLVHHGHVRAPRARAASAHVPRARCSATKPTLTDSPCNDTCSRSRRRSPRKHASSRVFDSFSDEEEGAVPRKAIATPSPSKAVAVAAKRAGVRAPRRLLALAEVSRAARCYHGGHNPARASFAHATND